MLHVQYYTMLSSTHAVRHPLLHYQCLCLCVQMTDESNLCRKELCIVQHLVLLSNTTMFTHYNTETNIEILERGGLSKYIHGFIIFCA
jgi:hypothetical protein